MPTLSSLRWLLLLAAFAGLARCVIGAATPGGVAFSAVCGLAWYALSRRKALSLDRGSLGIPPRRR